MAGGQTGLDKAEKIKRLEQELAVSNEVKQFLSVTNVTRNYITVKLISIHENPFYPVLVHLEFRFIRKCTRKKKRFVRKIQYQWLSVGRARRGVPFWWP